MSGRKSAKTKDATSGNRRSSISTLRISIDDGNKMISDEKSFERVINASQELQETDKHKIDFFLTTVNEAISSFQFKKAIHFAKNLVDSYPSQTKNYYLLAKCLYFNGEYRRAFWWLQKGQLIIDQKKEKDSPLSPLSPWRNTENDFNCFNVNAPGLDHDMGKEIQTKLFQDSTNPLKHFDLPSYDCLQAAVLGVNCLIACGEDDRALDLIDLFVYEESVENILQKADKIHLLSGKPCLISVLCAKRGQILLERQRSLEAIFYLKAALRCDPTNFEALEVLSNYQLNVTEANETLTEIKSSFTVKSYPFEIEQQYKKFLRLSNEDNVENFFKLGKVKEAQDRTSELILKDPNNKDNQSLHIQALLHSQDRVELYYFAHQCSKLYPSSYISYFAIGCYYFLLKRFAEAGKYFRKSTVENRFFLPAWYYFGQCFSKDDISDKAITVNELCLQYFIGSHSFPLAIGIEYLKMHNLELAKVYLKKALDICNTDPCVYSYIGVMYLNENKLVEAEEKFSAVFGMIKDDLVDSQVLNKYEGTLVNLAHCLRRQNKFSKALQIYKLCLSVNFDATTLTCIGICLHSLFKMNTLSRQAEEHNIKYSREDKHQLSECLSVLRKAMFHVTHSSPEYTKIKGLIDAAEEDYSLLLKHSVEQSYTFPENDDNVDAILMQKVASMQVLGAKDLSTSESSERSVYFQTASELYSKLDFNIEENEQSVAQSIPENEKNTVRSSFAAFDGTGSPDNIRPRQRPRRAVEQRVSPIALSRDFGDMTDDDDETEGVATSRSSRDIGFIQDSTRLDQSLDSMGNIMR